MPGSRSFSITLKDKKSLGNQAAEKVGGDSCYSAIWKLNTTSAPILLPGAGD
jgi:hypothetical protein